eukprot:GGOE01053247.1.p1 GENE.GGOE01053247.1~~GGOE01053247.1.p1  ORF type:complete len:770 (-),score=193.56 GGOE01053247.1:368-2551(-)
MAREGIVQTIDPFAPEDTDLVARQEFAFDYVFWSIPSNQLEADVPFATQEDVYKHAGAPALESLFDGYNGCIFAYGQTSSGKTHTMMGWTPPESERGLTPRLCEALFNKIFQAEEACRNISMTQGKLRKVEHSVVLSYLEIYNEKVLDLLTPKGRQDDELKVQYDPVAGPTVKGLKSVEVKDWPDVKHQFKVGTEHRTTAATAMNLVSSRSHAVVQLTMIQQEVVAFIKGKPKIVSRQSRINLVDLAGSEKVTKSQVTGQHLKEAIGINQSLTCLGRVIDGLVKGERHVPYRDSVLTQLLSDSLGGNSRTTMVATVSPAAVNYDETISTLRYASRARQIINVVKVNEDPTAQLIRELQEELAALRAGIVGGGPGGEYGGMGVGGAAQQAREVEAMLSQLQEREVDAQQKLEMQEREWADERAQIERGHQMTVAQLETEKYQLQREHLELQERTAHLESEVEQERAEKGAMQQQHEAAQAAAAEKQSALQRQRIIDRFRLASDKTRSKQQKEEVSRELADLKGKYFSLQQLLIERDRELLQRPPKHRGMYIGQELNRQARIPQCEMCYEANAVRYCHDCGGDYLCELCDLNQHRSIQTRSHHRTLVLGKAEGIALCEFCGVQRATVTCLECINGRLCSDCDDIKHRNKKRNFHHRIPGVSAGHEGQGYAPARTLIDEHFFPTNPAVVPRQSHTIASPTYPYTQLGRTEGSASSYSASPYGAHYAAQAW